MDGEVTTTVFSTATVTSTKTLMRTLVTAAAVMPTTASDIPLDSASTNPSHASIYPFSPSLPLAVVFTVLYLITTIHHGYLTLYLPTRPETVNQHRYTIPIFVSSLLSCLGFLIRTISMQKEYASNLSLYTASTALIMISPIFLCATFYLLLTRLITRCLPSQTVITPTRMTHQLDNTTANPVKQASALQKFLRLPPSILGFVFLLSDTLSFLTQLLGAALAASNKYTDPTLSQGTHTVLAGLALQLATFLLYLWTYHLFCRHVHRSPSHGFNPCIMKVVTALWVASGFVLLRTVFRLVEFAMGPDGYFFKHEWCLYVFEAFPVWVGVAVMGWWHPIKWIQERTLASSALQKGHGNAARGFGVVVKQPVAVGNSNGDGHVRKRSRVGFAW